MKGKKKKNETQCPPPLLSLLHPLFPFRNKGGEETIRNINSNIATKCFVSFMMPLIIKNLFSSQRYCSYTTLKTGHSGFFKTPCYESTTIALQN